MPKNSPSNSTKAGALLCPNCCVEYVEVEFDFEVDGVVLRNVKALRCPSCLDEQFSPEHLEAINRQISKANVDP